MKVFIWLTCVILLVSTAVCFFVVRIFNSSISSILSRLVSPELSPAWHRYITFAIYVVGISGGVRIWALERYINPPSKSEGLIELNLNRWIIELYSTIIQTLQRIAWMLLVFFVFALIAYVILRGFELRQEKKV